MIPRKTISERHIYTDQLIEALQKVKTNGIFTFQDASNIIGLKCQSPHIGYRYLRSAIDYLLKNDKKVFEPVVNVGYRLADTEDVAKSSFSILTKKKKALNKRMNLRVATTNDHYDGLSDEAKQAVNKTRTLIAMDSHIFKPKQLKAIGEAISQKHAMLGFGDTMKLFMED